MRGVSFGLSVAQMKRKKMDFCKVFFFQNVCPIQTDSSSFLATVSPRSQLSLAQTSLIPSLTVSFLYRASQCAEADLYRNFAIKHFSNSTILSKTDTSCGKP